MNTATAIVSVLSVIAAAPVGAGIEGVVLWNTMGSQDEIENSAYGLDGTCNGGGFTEGVFGGAYIADYTEDFLVSFPKEVVPLGRGTIEFWGRLVDFPPGSTVIPWGEYPHFFLISDANSGYQMQLTGNDGHGGGGLCAYAGRTYETATGWWYNNYTLQQILGVGEVEAWHHYALVWDADTIPGVGDGTKKTALFLDGDLESGRWEAVIDEGFPPLASGALQWVRNWFSQGSVAIDNIKIWDFAKTDFSDRFQESPFGVGLDIKPGSCPNSFNRNSNGVLPVALAGSEVFDVTQVDLGTILLSRADGVGGAVAPHEGPPGPHSVFEDVTTPFAGETCECDELPADGIMDLSMKFLSNDVLGMLDLNDLPNGDLVELVLSGQLLDGTAFSVSDCVRLVPPGTPPGYLLVGSNLPGVWIVTTPLDEQLDMGGFTSFNRAYPQNTVVTITAPVQPAAHPGWILHSWWVDGVMVPGSQGMTTMELVIEGEMRAVALLYCSVQFQFSTQRAENALEGY